MEFKIGDRVRRNHQAIVEDDVCSHCVVSGVPQICEVLSVDSNSVYVRCPDGTKETFNFGKFELASSNYKPKAPTHIVIWEEDKDPCRFFMSEKEAKFYFLSP